MCAAGMISGSPSPSPAPNGSAARHRPERVNDLFAAAYVVVPRREPHVDALMDRRGILQEVSAKESRKHQRQPAEREQRPIASHRVEREKHAGDHQRRSEILLQEEEHQQHRDRQTGPAAGIRAAEYRCAA